MGEWYVKPRNRPEFDIFILRQYSAEEFKTMFRVSRDTYRWLCAELDPYLRRKDTNWKKAVPVCKRVAIGLYFLANESLTYNQVGQKFAVGESTANKIVQEFCGAMVAHFGRNGTLQYPEGEGLQRIIDEFSSLRGLPNICGAIDGTHIRIVLPDASDARSYYGKEKAYTRGDLKLIAEDTDFRWFRSYISSVYTSHCVVQSFIVHAFERICIEPSHWP